MLSGLPCCVASGAGRMAIDPPRRGKILALSGGLYGWCCRLVLLSSALSERCLQAWRLTAPPASGRCSV
jgi:hypothetical protein